MSSCSNPTNIGEETEITTFCNKLSSLVWHISKHNVLTINGDIDVPIGKDRNNKLSLHNLPNRNREYLEDFSLENRLTCLNAEFKKKEEKLWIYTYPNNSSTAR